jgi:hypothetical protein
MVVPPRDKNLDTLTFDYFFITDRVKNKELTIEHCPTEAMLADFLTKPLQGGLFKRFRDVDASDDMAWQNLITTIET